MRLFIAGLLLISLCSCAEFSDERRIRQDREQINQKLYRQADVASAEARKAMINFLNCIERYVRSNATIPVTAAELADAAISDCKRDVSDYKYNKQEYYWAMDSTTVRSLNEIDRARDRSEFKAKQDTDALVTSGKAEAIRILIDTKRQR